MVPPPPLLEQLQVERVIAGPSTPTTRMLNFSVEIKDRQVSVVLPDDEVVGEYTYLDHEHFTFRSPQISKYFNRKWDQIN